MTNRAFVIPAIHAILTLIMTISVLSLGSLNQAAQAAEASQDALATVNGQVITAKDLAGALSSLNEGQRQGVLKDPTSRRQVLSGLIEQEVLISQAAREKLDQDREYSEALAMFRRGYLANRVLQKNLGNKLTDAAAKKFYEAHKQRYSTDMVHAQHILLSDETQAHEMLKKSQQKDADFQAMAEKFSKDPSAKNNRGDLGFFGRDRMVPEFTEAAFAGKPGEVVGPVKTAYGYHLIKVIEKKMGKAMEYREVEVRVKNDLRQELTQNYINELKKQAKIQVNDRAIDKL